MARRKLGQHFLVNGGILERIAAAATGPGEPLVIEIGPDKGSLTEKLLARAERVIAVEIDPELVDYLRRKFAGQSRLQVVQGNALTIDWRQWGPSAIAGNLPYYAATPIISRVLRLGWRGVFLIQKEVAERITAAPGSRDYGALTVEARLFSDPELLFDVPPAAFHPPPKVDSALVRLKPHPRAPELGIGDPEKFLQFVSRCFQHKRKTLRNNLTLWYGKETVDAWPEISLRAEQLSIERFAVMYRRLTDPIVGAWQGS